MSFNVKGAVQVPLELWGGLVTEHPPANLPAGVSPDCADVAFRPAAVFSRPALTKVFATPFGSVTLTYAKSYVDNSAVIRNLYLDSAGNLWVENITTSPGTVTLLATTTPGTYAKSITADGKEYIAISDALHGQEVPLQYDGTNLDRVTQDGPGAPPNIANLIIPATTMALSGSPAATMTRVKNVVTVTTSTPHGLLVGYLAEIGGVRAAAADTLISTLVINGLNLPGQALVTMTAPHGLAPGTFVSLHDIPVTVVGTSITAITRRGGIVNVTTSTPHGLGIGAIIQISGVGDNSFNVGTAVVQSIDPNNFTFIQTTDADGTSSGGTVNLAWPFPNTGANSAPGSVFEVQSCPTATSFIINITYADGTWTGGGVTIPWNGTFFVTKVLGATTFQYLQYGPDNSTTDIGTVTPFGQAAPGLKQMQVLFLTRQEFVTAPSPPVTIMCNGGQYLNVTNIPIGPSNVIARILAFTGADGADFFYIPATPINPQTGQVVGTATQINDNTTTSIVLDFSDNTLFDANGINTPGNQLFRQIVLDSALGFAFYGQRLVTYGQRNRIQNFLNMGFDGGHLPSSPTLPTGWLPGGSPPVAGGMLAAGHYGQGWQFTGAGSIFQSAYLDAYGAPILTPNTQYFMRAWLSGVGTTATLTISSASSGFSATATVTGVSATGSWLEATFSAKTPNTIPSDMILSLSGTGGGLVDELSVIFSQVPFITRTFFGSYVDNPEAFDGVSGVFGDSEDTHQIMDVGIIRGALCHLTRDPAGRLHSTLNNGTTEPAGWTTNEVAASCGALSAFCMTVSQADDATAGGGEEWMAWMSVSGPRIYGGDQAWKIGQEIQPDFDGINTGAYLTCWALNDPSLRRIYFGIPKGVVLSVSPTFLATAPNVIYHVDYKELDGAYAIAEAAPVHLTFTGKLVARDHARKWAPWRIPANGGAMIYRAVGGPLYTVFLAGNGAFPNTIPGGCGNVFALCDSKLTDDCLGQIFPYYTTYAFTSADLEQGLQLGGQRHLVYYIQWYALGMGHLRVTPLINTLTNPWPITCLMPLRADPTYDDEWGGGSAQGQRIFLKFEALP